MGELKLREYRQTPKLRAIRTPQKRTFFKPWLLVILIVVLGGVYAQDNLKEFAEKSIKEKQTEKRKFKLGNVTACQEQKIDSIVGIDVTGYKWAIDNYSVRHVLNKKAHGLIISDINKIYSTINTPDKVSIGKKIGNSRLLFIKFYGNYKITCVIEVRTGKKELALVTMHKSKTPITN